MHCLKVLFSNNVHVGMHYNVQSGYSSWSPEREQTQLKINTLLSKTNKQGYNNTYPFLEIESKNTDLFRGYPIHRQAF